MSKCSLYVFTIIPPRLSDPCNFITVLLLRTEVLPLVLVLVFECVLLLLQSVVLKFYVPFWPWERALYSDVSFIDINILYIVLVVI